MKKQGPREGAPGDGRTISLCDETPKGGSSLSEFRRDFGFCGADGLDFALFLCYHKRKRRKKP